MRTLLTDLKERYPMIIFDTPPMLVVSDAAVLADLADQMIVVIRAGSTRERTLRQLAHTIRRANLQIDGSILNGKTIAKGEYYDYYYNQSTAAV